MKHYRLELLDKKYYIIIVSSCNVNTGFKNAVFSINAPLLGASIRHIALTAFLTLFFGETNKRLKRIRNPLYRFLAILFGVHQIHKLAEVAGKGFETVQVLVFEDKMSVDVKCKASQTLCLQALDYVDTLRELGIELSNTITSSCQLLERYALTRSATFAGIGRL